MLEDWSREHRNQTDHLMIDLGGESSYTVQETCLPSLLSEAIAGEALACGKKSPMRDDHPTKSGIRRAGLIVLIPAIIIFLLLGVTLAQPLLTPTASPTSDLLIPISGNDETPNPTLRAAFKDVDEQFQESLISNIAYNVPKTMKLDDTVIIELLLNPSLSQEQLATQIVERGNIPPSAEPGYFAVTGGQKDFDIVTGDVIITARMKAVLKPLKRGAFEIDELHDSAEQPISSLDTTKWRWSVTAKESGEQTLQLVISRLIRYDDHEYWREVQSYKREIIVNVTPLQRLKSFDWKWILGILATALVIPLFFRWYDYRMKAHAEQKQLKPSKRRSSKK